MLPTSTIGALQALCEAVRAGWSPLSDVGGAPSIVLRGTCTEIIVRRSRWLTVWVLDFKQGSRFCRTCFDGDLNDGDAVTLLREGLAVFDRNEALPA